MNSRNKSTLAQALGYSLAGVAAAALAKGSTRQRGFSPLGFLSGRNRYQNPFKRGLVGGLLSAPLLSNFIGGRSVKRNLLNGALLGLSAGLGSMATPQSRGVFGRGGGILGAMGRGTRGGSGLGTIGRVLAGGLVAAAASKLINKTLRDRQAHEPQTYERTSRGRHDTEPHTHETRSQGRQTQDQPGF
ncbi:MAG TPA: hypothetical protein VFY40_24030 [Blastocatellia bacterium]|nr:hypothetical protein [Blastocatellia bacterium]